MHMPTWICTICTTIASFVLRVPCSLSLIAALQSFGTNSHLELTKVFLKNGRTDETCLRTA